MDFLGRGGTLSLILLGSIALLEIAHYYLSFESIVTTAFACTGGCRLA
jgi:hypothetical protein